jgi:putative ABC transport system permease protein
MERLFQDLRYGFRMLRKSPGFTAVAVMTLALGIGANTAIFSVMNAALLRALPYPQPGRLMMLFHSYPKLNLPRATVSPLGFDYYRNNVQSFEAIGAFSGYRAPQNLTGAGNPEQVRAVSVTGGFFPVLGIQAWRGRTIGFEADQGSSRVVVLSYGLWQQRYGGDPGMIGRDITLDGNNYTVIGIMPASFDYPHAAQLWVPIPLTADFLKVRGEFLNVVGRLKPGVTPGQAEAEMGKVTAEVLRIYPEAAEAGWRVIAVPFREVAVGNLRPALLVLLGAVGCVLLIACANIANLLLARSAGRQKEIAIRSAMGASRARVVRQLLTEGVLLALVGGGCGLLLGYWGIDALLRLLPAGDALMRFTINVDRNVLLFTIGVSVVTGLIFASAPALQSVRAALGDALKEGGRTSFTPGHHRFRAGLVIAEMALALVLLIGAGLMIRSFIRIQESDPGFDPQHVVTMQIALPQPKYKEETRVAQFYAELVQRVAALPGVKAAGLTSMLPLDSNWTNSFMIEGRNLTPAPHGHMASANPQYFSAMRIPLLRGRTFTDADTAAAPLVAVIDDALVRAYWPNEDPLGKRFRLAAGDGKVVWRQIVGIVASVKHVDPLAHETKGQAYFPDQQMPQPRMSLAVRASGDPTALVGAIRSQVLQIDPEQPIAEVKTMERALNEFVAQPRFNMLLLAVFAALALVLAAVGIYGVMAYSVAQRTHEIGLRMALGARREDVLRLVLMQAVRLAGFGLIIGLIGAFIATRVLATLLYGVKSTDPATFVVISLLLGGIAVMASYLPARRATKVDPMVALRYE